MADFYDRLDDKLKAFIADQHMFFIATAPNDGRINLSPKGMDTLRVLDDNTVCYLDLTGSGNETAAHLAENGRVTVMLCSFKGAANILRLYGTGESVKPGEARFEDLIGLFPDLPGVRQIFIIRFDSVQTSCGYGVPYYELVSERQTLVKWAQKKGDEVIAQYQADNNVTSIDGLPTGLLDAPK